MVTYDIKERLLLFLEQEKISVRKLEELCGFSNGYFANTKFKLPQKRIDIITNLFPHLNADWLLQGSGTMLSSGSFVVSNDREISAKKWHSEILSRLLLMLFNEKISAESFEEMHDSMRSGSLLHPNDEDLSKIPNTALIFIQEFPDYSPSWIFYGEGIQKRLPDKILPVYPIEILKDDIGSFKSSEYHISTFNSADCFVKVDSIKYSGFFKPGDLLACHIVKVDTSSLLSSLPYLIRFKDGEIFIRNLRWEVSDSIQELISFDVDAYAEDFNQRVIGVSYIAFIAEIVGYIRQF